MATVSCTCVTPRSVSKNEAIIAEKSSETLGQQVLDPREGAERIVCHRCDGMPVNERYEMRVPRAHVGERRRGHQQSTALCAPIPCGLFT